jgi:outer membrane protein OmpA-like peptidoglycan-associated protein
MTAWTGRALTARPVVVAATVLLGAGLAPTTAIAAIGASAPAPVLVTAAPVDPSTAVVLPVEDVITRSESLVFAEASADGAVTDRGGREFILAADVLFAFNQATLTARARREIRRIAAVLKSSSGPGAQPTDAAPTEGGPTGGGPGAKITAVTITGYTDDVGSDRYNLALARRRALAVRAELVKSLGAAVTVTAVGRGEQDPVATNNTERGRQANRRVEIRGR